ncbi:MAG: S8 family peptidase [Candidatus Hodarchaeales archaeon]
MRKKWKITYYLVIGILLVPFTFDGNFKLKPLNDQPISDFSTSTMNINEKNNPIFEEESGIPPELLGIEWVREIDQSVDINQIFLDKLLQINPIPESEGLTGNNITIAILDSGLNDSDWIEPNNIINRSSIPPNTSIYDNLGHGTLVGSIIAKIAPRAKIISIRVADNQGVAKKEWVEEGLRVAQAWNASIVHASIGSPDLNSLNATIISNLISQNISMVFAAGNSGPFGSSLTSPAIFMDAIAVGMTYNESFIPSVSSLGPRPSGTIGPDLVAPGVYIPSYTASNEPANVSGTSFAAPIVSGSLILLKEKFPNTTPSILKAALLETAQKLNHSPPIQQGNGLVDVYSAFQLLNELQSNPIIALTPKEISSDYSFFGQSLNGLNHTYRICLISSHKAKFEIINQTTISPFVILEPTQEANISQGYNCFNLTLFIPPELAMEDWKRNITFQFTVDNSTMMKDFPIHIKNKYPGGRVLFYQGYDNDTFIPDGPTGKFSQLALLLETYYGMQVVGAIRPNIGTSITDPLYRTSAINGKITADDLKNQDILVLADIELGISNEEVKIIEDWVKAGHSLLVLSYPSYKEHGIERLSNQTAVNLLLSRFGLEIEDDPSSPMFTRFSQGKTKADVPIFSDKNLAFEYNGTTVKVDPEGQANILATAQIINGESEELNIAGYWEDPELKGKVVAFGGLDPFSDLSMTSINQDFNLKVVSQIFRWLISDQQAAIEIVLTANPSIGSSTKIQLTITGDNFSDEAFNGTIIEANGSYTQISFEPSSNVYVGTWIPKAEGNAILWLNLPLESGTPTNGVYLLPVVNVDTQNLFLIVLFGSFILLAVGYYWIASRRSKTQLSIEEQLHLRYNKESSSPSQKSIDTLEICSKCRTPRFNQNSKYCFKCGKEL